MTNLLRSEWIKLRSVRVNYVLLIIAAAFPIIVVALINALTGDVDDISDNIAGNITGTMLVTVLLVGVVAALNLTSEYSHNTIRVTFAATPQRVNVLLAKAIVNVVFCAVFVGIVELICFGIGRGIVSARDGKPELTGSDKAAMLGLIGLTVLLVLLAYGLGMVIRNSPATIVTFILWPLLLESIVRGILSAAGVDNPTPWLPYQSAFTMANPDPEPSDPGRLRAGLFLLLIVVGLLIIGTVANDRRDA
jgi:ABC-2 type transport system permease protein